MNCIPALFCDWLPGSSHAVRLMNALSLFSALTFECALPINGIHNWRLWLRLCAAFLFCLRCSQCLKYKWLSSSLIKTLLLILRLVLVFYSCSQSVNIVHLCLSVIYLLYQGSNMFFFFISLVLYECCPGYIKLEGMRGCPAGKSSQQPLFMFFFSGKLTMGIHS